MSVEHHEVLIIGAGLSGIGMACQLTRRLPGIRFAILEARAQSAGTWDLFRYPGIRSDSDMFTLGYNFRPWSKDESIAAGSDIRDYIRQTAREYGVDRRIRYQLRVLGAEWKSDEQRWWVTAEQVKDGQLLGLSCDVLFLGTGYYHYGEGYTPKFAGVERFRGPVIHPQHWPETLDYANKRVVVIGSGATAVTLVPAMAERAAHVTMLQRSPTYVVSRPARDPIAHRLRALLPSAVAYRAVRLKNAALSALHYQLSRRRPSFVKKAILSKIQEELPDFDVATHFTPSYQPWDQRLCLVPDGDMFAAIRDGRVKIVTDQIETFVETGIQLKSGGQLEADIIVTATGLQLLPFGGMSLTVDGRPIDLSRTVTYKGTLLCGVPNIAYATGYTNASWTLKLDLVTRYLGQILEHMRAHGYTEFVPAAPDSEVTLSPIFELQSNYVKRGIDAFPKQADRLPWRTYHNYFRDLRLLRLDLLDRRYLQFSRAQQTTARKVATQQTASTVASKGV